MDSREFKVVGLKQLIETHRQELALRQLCCHRCCHHPRNNNNNDLQEIIEEDQRLSNWLEGLGIHESAKRIFLSEGYTLEEVLYHINREDLEKVGLKGSTILRIWRAVEQHRLGNEVIICNGVTTDESGTV